MATPDEVVKVERKGPITAQLDAQEATWENGLEAQLERDVDTILRSEGASSFLEFKRREHNVGGRPYQLITVREKVYVLTINDDGVTGIGVLCGDKVGLIPVNLTSKELTDERRIVQIDSDGDNVYAVIGEEHRTSDGYFRNCEVAIIRDLDQIANVKLDKIYFVVPPPKRIEAYRASLRYMCVKTGDNCITLVNTSDGKTIKTFDLGDTVNDAAFSYDGERLYVSVGDNTIAAITYEEIIRLPKGNVSRLAKGLAEKFRALRSSELSDPKVDTHADDYRQTGDQIVGAPQTPQPQEACETAQLEEEQIEDPIMNPYQSK